MFNSHLDGMCQIYDTQLYFYELEAHVIAHQVSKAVYLSLVSSAFFYKGSCVIDWEERV